MFRIFLSLLSYLIGNTIKKYYKKYSLPVNWPLGWADEGKEAGDRNASVTL